MIRTRADLRGVGTHALKFAIRYTQVHVKMALRFGLRALLFHFGLASLPCPVLPGVAIFRKSGYL